MLVFYILLLTPILLQHIAFGNNNIDYEKKNKRALLFFFVFLTVLLALRHESVGNDTRNYIYYFNNFSAMDWGTLSKESVEFGFSYFNKLVSIFTNDPQVFFSVAAIVTSLMIYPTYKRLCVDPSLSIVVYCIMSTFVMAFSGIRQMLAVGIGFFAYRFTRKRKIIPFIIAVAIAITFHISAFMLIFMYPIFHSKITKKWLIFIIPIIAMVFVFNKQIFSSLAFIINRFTTYNTSITQTGAFTMIVLFGIFTVFSFVIPDENKLDSETIGLRNFLLLCLVLQMFAPLHSIAMRMNYYYIIFIPLLLPKIIEARSDRWGEVALVGRHVMVVFFLVYFFFSARGGGLHVFPYHFFWETV